MFEKTFEDNDGDRLEVGAMDGGGVQLKCLDYAVVNLNAERAVEVASAIFEALGREAPPPPAPGVNKAEVEAWLTIAEETLAKARSIIGG